MGKEFLIVEKMNRGTFNSKHNYDGKVDDRFVIGYEVSMLNSFPLFIKEENFKMDNPIDFLSFGDALDALEDGKRVARKGWNGKGIFIELQVPDKNSKMSHPYIYIDTTGLESNNPDAKRNLVPWLASQTDMLAKDWIIVG